MFRHGECIGFAETLPVTSSYEVPEVIQTQLDSLVQRVIKQEQNVTEVRSQPKPVEVEP